MGKSAKHTKQSFNDQHAVGLLSSVLASSHRVMPDLKANDKWPNIDGILEMTDKDGHPTGLLKVQVKKLTKTQARSRSYTFSKKSKFLDYCRDSQDWIPILLIGVDVEVEKSYWIHIGHDYLEATKGSRAIKFSESQVIEKGDTQYISDWEKLIDLYSSKSQFFDQFKHAYSTLADVLTPALGRRDPRYISIHQFLDQTNYMLDYVVPSVKRIYYPGSWKLGFALYKFTDKEMSYSLYPIGEDRNDVQIKEVDKSLHNLLLKQGLDFAAHYGDNPILEAPSEYANRLIKDKTLNVVRRRLLNHAGSDFLAKEFMFAFIDKFHVQLGLERRDTYSIEEIEFGLYSYLPVWVEEAYKFLVAIKRNSIDERVKHDGYYDIDIFNEIMPGEERTIKENVARRMEGGYSPEPTLLSVKRGMSIVQFKDFLNYLKQRGNPTIERIYKVKDYALGAGFLHKTLSEEDALHNLRIIVGNYQSAYETIVVNNFPGIKEDLSLFKNVDKILYHFNILTNNSRDKTVSTYDTHNLISTSGQVEKEISIVDDSTSENLRGDGFFNNSALYNSHSYKVYSGGGILDFLYEDTPLLNLVYSTLEDRLKNYFDNN